MALASPTSRSILALFFVAAGTYHFVNPDFYLGFMPPWLPYHLALVYISGVFEILGGVGVLIRPLRPIARWGLIALLLAVFPANIQMTLNSYAEGGWSLQTIVTIIRLPFQLVLIAWVWAACKER